MDTDSRGFAAIHLNGEIHEEYYKSDQKEPEHRRVLTVEKVKEYFASLPDGTYVFCEEPLILPKNWITTRNLSLSAGAIWACHCEFDLTWFWVNVSSWKRDIIEKGNASKLEIIQWFNQRGTYHPECLDLYDAHAIAMYGIRQFDAMEAVCE